MKTAERRTATGRGVPAGRTAATDTAREKTAPAGGSATRPGGREPRKDGGDVTEPRNEGAAFRHRSLWVEEPASRHRMADPVRTAAVRAVLIVSVTLIQAMVAFFCTLAESWLAFPMVLSGVLSTVVATWSVLDVWVTRQVWKQRHGVVSTPSSTARALRRERRRAHRQQRRAERERARQERRGAREGFSRS
ncbi:hypothetical protein [Streptomyces sp. NPDC049906]|uniref:hypothetical protein n=1 Tax=Streptomyces sp. NPDC049906 TaxID=3155656 RepID=UPI00343B8A5C